MPDPLFDPYLDHLRQVQPNRLPPEERYRRDPHFRTLVDAIWSLLRHCEYTPTEVREASMLAQEKHERDVVRPLYLGPDGKVAWRDDDI